MKMNNDKKHDILLIIVLAVFFSLLGLSGQEQPKQTTQTTQSTQSGAEVKTGKHPMSLQDIMKFKTIKEALISDDGRWLVYTAQPDRGNSEVMVYRLGEKKEPYERISRGKSPAISRDSRWIASLITPDAPIILEFEKKKKKDATELQADMKLLDTATGNLNTFENVKSFAFAENSQWLTYRGYASNKEKFGQNQIKKDDQWSKRTFILTLRHLASQREIRIENVLYYALEPSPSGRYLVYSIYNGEGQKNGLYVRDLSTPAAPEKTLHSEIDALYTNLTWSKTNSRLAYILHRHNEAAKNKKTFSSGLWVWSGDGVKDKHYSAVPRKNIPKGWMIPAENKLQWSEDGERLFFGFKPYDEYLQVLEALDGHNSDSTGNTDIYNINGILEKRAVDVWRSDDPIIIPQQKKEWEQFRKRIYPAVYHFQVKQFIPLTDKIIPELQIPENPDVALSSSDRPYLKENTWDDHYKDYYLTYLSSGFRSKILTRHQYDVSLSPRGQYVVYYKDKHWYLYDVRLKFPRRITGGIETPFYNEDHDFPNAVPGYGIAGWTENDRSVLIYDKYDIWEFYTGSNANKFICLTEGLGRKNSLIFRIQKLDPEATYFRENEKLLLTAYSDEEKYTAFYRGEVGKPGVERTLHGKKKFTFLRKARKADRIIYTREDFGEFPDIWVSDLSFKALEKVTDVNPQKEEFLWGATQLIEWKSLNGTGLQGVVIKPENYDSSKRYPVLVYWYRFFSDRLYEFSDIKIDQYPCLPYYAGHGYVIFLPDIRLQVGQPGNSAFGCLVPGVQKLIEIGIADPKAIALRGHSWGGYMTAFIITQTNMFAAAVAGAPVANMTSAYSGIRWQNGMPRQFQYEKGQSRIGKSLWENPELYIENSPVFFAHRIETPLLIEFGNNDGVVPWQQGIELYLAMRRLNKNCILLEYNDEGHYLDKYADRLDFTIKMKEFLDHYLKGTPAPNWMVKGVPYRKK
ncbi:MAG: hypothetical protein QG657_3634 [Acidobacteriota bacterium]|nr:hypothetical protein [Acidobacteriota bacterium]